MIKTKEEKDILITSIIVTLSLSLVFGILGFIFEAIKWTWCFSIILGGATSIICFLKSNFIITKVLYTERSSAKGLMALNNVISIALYLIILIINYLTPGLHILVCLVGILILKFVTFIIGSKMKKWGEIFALN